MKPKFKFGQFIVKKAWECDNNKTSYADRLVKQILTL